MFNDRYGLTQAVLEGRKTMTRRIAEKVLVEDIDQHLVWTGEFKKPKFEVGEVVAVAQSYKDAGLSFIYPPNPQWGNTEEMQGYNNKMFVLADLMPHRIRITDVRVERLQDIRDEDCVKEGVKLCNAGLDYWYEVSGFKKRYGSPRSAFAALIDKISGKGTWDSNPYMFVYEFKLLK